VLKKDKKDRTTLFFENKEEEGRFYVKMFGRVLKKVYLRESE